MKPIAQLTIIGVGLIGGSLARALRQAGAVQTIVGSGRGEANLIRAQELGVIDRYTLDLAEAVAGADVVLVGVPLGAMHEVFAAIAPALRADAIVTDVGSAKATVVADARRAFGVRPNFVPGHPIAGTERSGVEASFAELFQRRRVILTPLPETDPAALARVSELWRAAGADVVDMSVAHHDEILAATSHLPHLLAYGLVDTLSRWDDSREVFQFAAGGFRDFTRIASSDPIMWRDICIANREALSASLERYMEDLAQLAALVRASDGPALEKIFRNAKQARDRFVAMLEQ
jgi:prephenate dehydrogenase